MKRTYYYTGIGARKTPGYVLQRMTDLAKDLANLGVILRSGGAAGADMAFETGCKASENSQAREIYLPWPDFNGNESQLHHVCDDALTIAKNTWNKRPDTKVGWDRLKRTTKLFMARNCYQVLGKDLVSASNFVVCYCEKRGNHYYGGTAQALKLAAEFNIPILNYAEEGDLEFSKFQCLGDEILGLLKGMKGEHARSPL